MKIIIQHNNYLANVWENVIEKFFSQPGTFCTVLFKTASKYEVNMIQLNKQVPRRSFSLARL